MATDPGVETIPRARRGRRGVRPLQPSRPYLLQVHVSADEKERSWALAAQLGYETWSAFARHRLLGDPAA